MAAGFSDLAQSIEVGPGPLRVHVVGSDGRDPAPVVDAGVEQRPEVVGEVRRSLQVDLGWQEQPGRGDGPQVLVARAGRRPAHEGGRLGQEVLHDHFLHVAVAGVARRDRPERLEPILAGLADADQDPRGERDLQLAGRLEGGEPPGRLLVRRGAVAVEGRVEGFEHHPLAGRDGSEHCQLLGSERAGVGVGEQPRFLGHHGAHGSQVLDRRGVAPLGEPVPCHRVAVLGAFPQREQRFVATPLSARPGDAADLSRLQVQLGGAGR